MTRLIRRVGVLKTVAAGLVSAVAILGTALVLPPAAGASGFRAGPARLIDTTRVVGFPQHFTLTAAPGNPFGQEPPGSFGGEPPTHTTGVAPTITSDPQSETVPNGSTATFKATASGSPTPTVQWEDSINDGTTWTAISRATSTTYSFTASSSENGYWYEAVFTNSAGHATTTAATLTVTAAAPAPEESSNWSGYADVGATFNAVSASWTVPTLTCTGSGSAYSAHWIGIDGYSSDTVEQDGTEADCINGAASYDAWYEMYGDNAVDSGYEVELSPTTNPVSPGDPISASVSVSNNEWTLSITDSSSSHSWTYTTTPPIDFTAKQSSAEWVVERPEICSRSCSLTSLADFGSVTFSNASAATGGSSGPISAYSNAAIEMVNGRTVLALPGALGSNGTNFTDTWKAS
jgi:hypothetical protein